MTRRIVDGAVPVLLVCLVSACASTRRGTHAVGDVNPAATSQPGETSFEESPFDEPEAERVTIRDPLEKLNRGFFWFNDKLYFWVLKPAATCYSKVMPEQGRVYVRNFFTNVRMPVRVVNCLLQGRFKGAGAELGRFGINTTVGILGFGDPATQRWNLPRHDEDLGQTLGVYGFGPWFYICWPVAGPSNPRDTVGAIGDSFLDPIGYIPPWYVPVAVHAYDAVNGVSLRLGDYEKMKQAAIDPYVAIRDGYAQRRKGAVEKR